MTETNNDPWADSDDVESGLDAELWSPLENHPRVGRYVRTEEVTVKDNFNAGKTRQSTVHYFTDPNGATFKMWGSFDLDSRVSQLNAGDVVRITYEGLEQDGSKSTKRWKVQKAKDPTAAMGIANDDIPF